MELHINTQTLPPIYLRNGKECYLDPIRQKLVYITPEETVRQHMISYLLNTLKIPKDMIAVEERLSHYDHVKSPRRADIIIHRLESPNTIIPIAIIECKAPDVLLGTDAENQVIDYCNLLYSDYAILTNGQFTECFHYDENENQYFLLDGFPTYAEMAQGADLKHREFEPLPRIPYHQIPDVLKNRNAPQSDSYLDISTQTPEPLACAGLNLWEGLLDLRHRFPAKQYRNFRVIQDYGNRLLSYGNASGGIFNGVYRSFLIEYHGSTEFVSFGVSTYGNDTYPDLEKTALNVAIDTDDEAHHSLQLVLEDNLEYNGNRYHFYHHGRIGIGNIGSGKISELRELVQKHCPELILGNRFYLGSLTYDRDWNLDDPEVVSLLENLISYALLRDEYRKLKKASCKK